MAISISLTGTSTLDETAGLQTGADGTPTSGPRADTDVVYTSLPSAFTTRLTALGADATSAGSFAATVGASSAVNMVGVTSDGKLSTIGLTDSNGDAFDGTVWSGLYTDRYDDSNALLREKIYLVSDSDNQIVLGVTDPGTANEQIVFAVYLDPSGTDTSKTATLWSVTFEPMFHPSTASPDDAVDLLSQVYLTATGSKTFNFNNLPSGQNLFGIVGDTNDAIVVIGQLPVLNPDGTFTNASDTINTSKGGGDTTIGVDEQNFDAGTPNDGAFFTYVEDPDPRYLAGAPGGLSQGEADDADNVLFGNTKEVGGAFLKIVQVTGNGTASLSLTAYDLANDTLDGRTFVQDGMGAEGGAKVDITHVWVYNGSIAAANLLEDSAGNLSNTIGITITNGVASVSGLDEGYVVVWETAADHDQVLVQANTGTSPFDIGLFGLNEGDEQSASLAGRVFVEDDGPRINPAIADSTVHYTAGATATQPLNGSSGTDSPGSYAITSFTGSVTLTGVTIIGTINTDQTEVHYFQDKDASGTFTAGDVDYYTLSLTQPGGVDSYTFTVNNAPAAPPLEFDFAGLPSGQNLFGMVADAGAPNGPGLLFFGENADINDPGNGQYTNTSDTINTSKGGGPTTIGINNQMFDGDLNDGAYFTIVNNPDDRYLANVSGGLTQNEADDADNMLYNSLKEVNGAFFKVSQTQGNVAGAATVEAFNIDQPATARALIDASGDPSDQVDITKLSVYNGSVDPTNLLETTAGTADGGMSSSITVSIDSDGVASVSGLLAGYVVAWETSGTHDQVLIEATAGKFDIGAFGVSEAQAIPDHTLNFTTSFTDADGDAVSDSFQVTVDAVPFVV
jgi:hypothetical protein